MIKRPEAATVTLKYRILRKPGNIEEFADKCKKKGIDNVCIGRGFTKTYHSEWGTSIEKVEIAAESRASDDDEKPEIGYGEMVFEEDFRKKKDGWGRALKKRGLNVE